MRNKAIPAVFTASTEEQRIAVEYQRNLVRGAKWRLKWTAYRYSGLVGRKKPDDIILHWNNAHAGR